MAVVDDLDDGFVLLVRRAIDLIVEIAAHAGLVGRDLDNLETVDVGELGRLRHRGTGHAGELGISAKIILESDRGKRLVLVLDVNALLGLECLVQTFREPPALHHAPGELVDDDDRVVLDDVIGISFEQSVGAKRLVDVVDHRDVCDVVHRRAAEHIGFFQQLLDALGAALGQHYGALLLVLLEVIFFEDGNQFVDPLVHLGRILGRARDDQRRPRLVDEDVVDLVDDCVVERPLHHGLGPRLHVVTQIVEPVFVVGAVSHVGPIGCFPLDIIEAVHDAPDLEAEELVNLPHPFGVAHRQVVVDGHNVDALAR